MNNKVVLAFSGGLDTSFCVPYLKNEKGLEVHTIMVNTGGFSEAEAKAIEERALTLGAASHVTVDAFQYLDSRLQSRWRELALNHLRSIPAALLRN